jgi:2-dehydropantoate 2-reductase
VSAPLRVCVVGLGAVGGVLAARLAALTQTQPQRLAVCALARGATLAAVRRQGLVLQAAGATLAVPLQASDDPAALGSQDLVIAALKAPALPAAAEAIAALAGDRGAVLTAMNGLPWWFFDRLDGPARGLVLPQTDPGGTLHARIATGRVIGAVVHFAAAVTAPAQVVLRSGNGLIVGLPGAASAGPGGVDPGHPAGPDQPAAERLAPAAALLADAGFELTVTPAIEREVWFKLWGNMTMNPVSALTLAPCDEVLDDPLTRALCSAVMREAQALGAAFGIPIAQEPEDRHAITRRLGSFKTSMLQDLEAGRALELDALLGAPVAAARALGVATPQMDALFGLARLMARRRGLYPR